MDTNATARTYRRARPANPKWSQAARWRAAVVPIAVAGMLAACGTSGTEDASVSASALTSAADSDVPTTAPSRVATGGPTSTTPATERNVTDRDRAIDVGVDASNPAAEPAIVFEDFGPITSEQTVSYVDMHGNRMELDVASTYLLPPDVGELGFTPEALFAETIQPAIDSLLLPILRSHSFAGLYNDRTVDELPPEILSWHLDSIDVSLESPRFHELKFEGPFGITIVSAEAIAVRQLS